jgi:hypothetical protein
MTMAYTSAVRNWMKRGSTNATSPMMKKDMSSTKVPAQCSQVSAILSTRAASRSGAAISSSRNCRALARDSFNSYAPNTMPRTPACTRSRMARDRSM